MNLFTWQTHTAQDEIHFAHNKINIAPNELVLTIK